MFGPMCMNVVPISPRIGQSKSNRMAGTRNHSLFDDLRNRMSTFRLSNKSNRTEIGIFEFEFEYHIRFRMRVRVGTTSSENYSVPSISIIENRVPHLPSIESSNSRSSRWVTPRFDVVRYPSDVGSIRFPSEMHRFTRLLCVYACLSDGNRIAPKWIGLYADSVRFDSIRDA